LVKNVGIVALLLKPLIKVRLLKVVFIGYGYRLKVVLLKVEFNGLVGFETTNKKAEKATKRKDKKPGTMFPG
jgi:hypothetical protein